MFYDHNAFSIQRIQNHHQGLVHNFFIKQWGSTEMILSSGTYKVNELEGFIASDKSGEIRGIITYIVHQEHMEIIPFNSLMEKNGVGSRLLFEVEMIARERGLKKVTVLTTNDNIDALRFYQRKGYRLTEVIINAVELARQHKPQIPKIGHNQIPIHDELKLTKMLTVRGS
ncbi:MAG: GNAT family N-acetyltransferase [Anaerobacillus sp.]